MEIDLNELTRMFGKSKLSPLRYSIVGPACFRHGIVFLSSYLHDAEFTEFKHDKRRGTLEFSLQRCCWEYYTRLQKPFEKTLPGAQSVLRISEVSRYELDDRRTKKGKFVIDSAYLDREYFESRDAGALVICNPHDHWRLVVHTTEKWPSIQLDDVEVPVL
ncbi:MAG TPA: hypothetical protein VK968_19075 [Roseimicrobium sp.]|nr:hypothetical protein [Roseimicrobium sp.]